MNDTREIKTSSYDIQERWLKEIAPKYFDMDNINLLNAGVFGYINNISSTSLEDSLHGENIYYNEVIPITAKLPKSIYSYASMTDDEDYNAIPAVIPVSIAIRKTDIINKAQYRDNNIGYKSFMIDRHSSVIIDGDKKFMFDYDIEIIVKEINRNGDVMITPVYNIDGLNERSSIKNKYIKSVTLPMEDGNEYLFMSLFVRQMDRKREEIFVISRDMLDTLSFEVKYTGKLSHFNVFYQENNTKETKLLTKYFIDNLNPTVNEFCFYEYLDEETIRIYFSPYSSYFRPENGSKLIIDIYTTDGSEGNFNYQGNNVLLKFATDNPKIQYDYKGIMMEARVSGKSEGGCDGKTLNEIKQNVLDSFTTRKGLINETDLNIFFNKHKKNSDIRFLKKRDDISRLFSAFILLKDDKNLVVPSNTADILIDENKCLYERNENIYMIKAGQTFQNNDDINNIYENIEEPTKEEIRNKEEVGKFITTNPYLIQINTQPMLTKYFLNSINDKFYISHKYINYNVLHQFILSDILVDRDAINKKDEYYNINFNIRTTLDLSDDFISSMFPDDNNDKKRPIIVKGIIRHKNSDLAMFDCTPQSISTDGKRINYKARLRTTDYINVDNGLEMNNLKSIYENSLSNTFFIPDTNTTIEILVFYNGYEDKTKDKLGHISYLKDYCLVSVYETDRNVEFIKDISGIVNSYSKLQKNSSNGYDIYIRSTPLIRKLYITDIENVHSFYDNIYYHASLLKNNLNRLENNFDIDFKFFNTYGKSNYFIIGSDRRDLDKTNIKLKFRIKLLINITNEIDNEIKTYIQHYVENLNINSNSFYISKLIGSLEQNFKYIAYTEFKGINEFGASEQKIENRILDYYKLNKIELYKYVPEYININKVLDPITNQLVPEILIEYI